MLPICKRFPKDFPKHFIISVYVVYSVVKEKYIMFTLLIVSFVLFAISIVCLFYLFSHPDDKNTFLNILTLVLFGLAAVLMGIYQALT